MWPNEPYAIIDGITAREKGLAWIIGEYSVGRYEPTLIKRMQVNNFMKRIIKATGIAPTFASQWAYCAGHDVNVGDGAFGFDNYTPKDISQWEPYKKVFADFNAGNFDFGTWG